MNPIEFWKYITKPVTPIPGDIELKAVQWHFFHFGISFILCWLISSVVMVCLWQEIAQQLKDWIYIGTGILLSIYFIYSELSQVKINKVSEESIKDYENNGGILLIPDKWEELKDAATDMNQYMSCWVFSLWALGLHIWSFIVLGVILIVYYLTIKCARP